MMRGEYEDTQQDLRDVPGAESGELQGSRITYRTPRSCTNPGTSGCLLQLRIARSNKAVLQVELQSNLI